MTVEAEEVDDGAHGATHPHLRRQSALPGRGGLARIAAAVSNSIRGLREGLLTEAAVKQELALAAVLLPASFFVASNVWGYGSAWSQAYSLS